MVEKIPQFEDSQPILTPQSVTSKASGYEEFAKTLGSLAEKTGEAAINIEKERSNATLMTSSAQMQTAKINSEINLMQYPDQSQRISDSYAEQAETIEKNSELNKHDRGKLRLLANDNFNSVRLRAAQVGFEQSKKSLSIEFWNSYPSLMKGVHEALIKGDFDKAKILEDSLNANAMNAAKMGAISPQQLGNIVKSNSELYDNVNEFISMANHPDNYSAADFNAVGSSPYNNDEFNNVGFPTHGNTQQLTASSNFDRTMSGQYSNLYGDKPLNFGVLSLASENQRNDFKQQWLGVNTIKGAVNAGVPFHQIDKRIKSLEAKPYKSEVEKGEINYWKTYQNNYKNNSGYLQSMSSTVLGGRYTQDHAQEASAIINSSKSRRNRKESLRQNDNKYIGQMIYLGIHQGVEPENIKPIYSPWVDEVQDSFREGAPINTALDRIKYIDAPYRPYLANAMEKPNQTMAVYLAGATLGKADTTFQAQLLASNQEGAYKALIQKSEDKTKNIDIKDDLFNDSNMKSIYKYMGLMPHSSKIHEGLSDVGNNYVLYRADKDSDFTLNNKSKYVKDYINGVKEGFDIQQGSNYIFNGKSLPYVSRMDMDFLSDYAISEAYENIHEGRSESNFQSYIDLNPLQTINTPDGRIVVIDRAGNSAVDKNGHPAFDLHYSKDMLNEAYDYGKRSRHFYHSNELLKTLT